MRLAKHYKCPHCGNSLVSAGMNRRGTPIYQCGNCLLTSGTYMEMVRHSRIRKHMVETTSAKWLCSNCGKRVITPTFAFITVEGAVTTKYVCKDCDAFVQEAEARKKINAYKAIKKDNVTEAGWVHWFEGLDGYIFKDKIYKILVEERKINDFRGTQRIQ